MNNNYNDYQKGFQDGLNNRSISVAIKMLQKNIDKNLIQEISELSEEQIHVIEETLLFNQHNVDQIVESCQNDTKTK